jgi:hypothetical protein
MAVPKGARILDPCPANDNFVGRRGGGGMLIMDPSADDLAGWRAKDMPPLWQYFRRLLRERSS